LLGAAAAVTIVLLLFPARRDPVEQALVRVAHASGRGDLQGLFVSLRDLDPKRVELGPPSDEVLARLRDPGDEVFKRLEATLQKRDDRGALEAAARRLAASWKARDGGLAEAAESPAIEALLGRYLLFNTDPSKVASDLCSHALVLIVRLFQENPV